MKEVKVEITEDGSHTLFVPAMNEHYHSTHGAVQESAHVYIDAGMRCCKKQRINVLEIGFGTGLNAFLTLRECEKTGQSVFYRTLELNPLPIGLTEKLNYAKDTAEKALFMKLHTSEWEKEITVTENFTLMKNETDFSNPDNFAPQQRFDVVYFDAFAPEKQPEMWTQAIFDKLYSLCEEAAVVTTYCAKGAVRRMMQTAGFVIERLPGPPGKREMLRGKK